MKTLGSALHLSNKSPLLFTGFGSDEWVYPGVVGMTKLNATYASLTRQYVQCFYWSTFTLTTIGELTKPHTTLEFSFVILDFLIGMYMLSLFLLTFYIISSHKTNSIHDRMSACLGCQVRFTIMRKDACKTIELVIFTDIFRHAT